MVNNIIKVVLLAIIIALAYLVIESVMKPVRFQKEVDHRNQAVTQNLIDIRSAQMQFKSINGHFTASFDTLVQFLKTGSIPVIKMLPDPSDTTFTRTIRDTIGYIPVADSLFKHRKGYDLDKIRYVPFTNNIPFEMDAGTIDKGGVSINVFEASVHFKVYLEGLDKQMVTNLIATREHIEKYPGMKVGSMTEASTDGNWE